MTVTPVVLSVDGLLHREADISLKECMCIIRVKRVNCRRSLKHDVKASETVPKRLRNEMDRGTSGFESDDVVIS